VETLDVESPAARVDDRANGSGRMARLVTSTTADALTCASQPAMVWIWRATEVATEAGVSKGCGSVRRYFLNREQMLLLAIDRASQRSSSRCSRRSQSRTVASPLVVTATGWSFRTVQALGGSTTSPSPPTRAQTSSGPRTSPSSRWQPINWTEAERAKGQAWGLKTIESFHTHGTPPLDEPA
jgi:hypothetical protein